MHKLINLIVLPVALLSITSCRKILHDTCSVNFSSDLQEVSEELKSVLAKKGYKVIESGTIRISEELTQEDAPKEEFSYYQPGYGNMEDLLSPFTTCHYSVSAIDFKLDEALFNRKVSPKYTTTNYELEMSYSNGIEQGTYLSPVKRSIECEDKIEDMRNKLITNLPVCSTQKISILVR